MVVLDHLFDKFSLYPQYAGETVAASDKFAVFEQWLLDNGSKFPKLYLKALFTIFAHFE